MDFGIASVAAITVLVSLVGQAVKATSLNNKWIPIICGFVGGILGVAALYIGMPDFPAEDYITASAIGVVSGLAATGAHQTIKQLYNNN